MTTNENEFFGWDDEITSNGSEFTTLLPGTYEGEITKVTKGRWDKAGNMYGCPYAEVTVSVLTPEGNTALVKDNLFLSRKTEFKIAAFLMALGLKKKDESIKASRIDKAQGKNVKIIVTCQYKVGTKYQDLDSEQAANALKEGVNVYNSIKQYLPSDKKESQDGTFSFGKFGYAG